MGGSLREHSHTRPQVMKILVEKTGQDDVFSIFDQPTISEGTTGRARRPSKHVFILAGPFTLLYTHIRRHAFSRPSRTYRRGPPFYPSLSPHHQHPGCSLGRVYCISFHGSVNPLDGSRNYHGCLSTLVRNGWRQNALLRTNCGLTSKKGRARIDPRVPQTP